MTEEIDHEVNQLTLDKPNDYDRTINGKSTIFMLSIEPYSTAYCYDVSIVKVSERQTRKDELTYWIVPGMRLVQRQCCLEILSMLSQLTQGFGSGCKFVYDGKKILYTNKPIEMAKTNRLAANQLPQRVAEFVKKADLDITIVANGMCQKVDYSDLKSALTVKVSEQDRSSVRTFLELLTSQYLINSSNYQYIPKGCLFENNVKDFDKGMQLREGFKKGVRIVGKDTPQALIVLDMKKSVFFSQKSVLEVYNEFVQNDSNGISTFDAFMRGVRVIVRNDPSQSLVYGRLTSMPASECKIQGKPLPQLMTELHGIEVKFPELPAAELIHQNGSRLVYPLELLIFLDDQSVPIQKMSSKTFERMVAENSVKPEERYTYVLRCLRAISSGEAAKFLSHFGAKIESGDDGLKIRQRNLPKVMFGGGKTVNPQVNGIWLKEANGARFISPSNRLHKWIIAYDDGVPEQKVRDYFKKLKTLSSKSGMTIPDPKSYHKIKPYQLEKLFIESEGLVQLIFYVSERYDDRIHWSFKLYEAYYKILTQQVMSSKLDANDIILNNVLRKLNTKAFGLCFIPVVDPTIKPLFSLDHNDLLVIGIDLAHPQKMNSTNGVDLKSRHPSVVAVSANKMRSAWGFSGDFFYQPFCGDLANAELLTKAVHQLVETAKKANRSPQRVIVFRDGLSEAQQEQVIDEEIPAIKQGIKEVCPDLDPKITFIVLTKRHKKRFYHYDGKTASSTGPGDVIDSKVVREDLLEFYIQMHKQAKGTPKMLQVTVLVNELHMTMSQVQKMILMLSSMHQVSTCTTSLPLPVYLADETAKRGMKIYVELYEKRFPSNRSEKGSSFGEEKLPATNGVFDFEKLTDVLGYASNQLAGTRFNA